MDLTARVLRLCMFRILRTRQVEFLQAVRKLDTKSARTGSGGIDRRTPRLCPILPASSTLPGIWTFLLQLIRLETRKGTPQLVHVSGKIVHSTTAARHLPPFPYIQDPTGRGGEHSFAMFSLDSLTPEEQDLLAKDPARFFQDNPDVEKLL